MTSKLQVFVSVKDTAAQVFGKPFLVPSNNVALRSFTDEVNRESAENMMYLHPDDFELYAIGYFNDDLGLLVSVDVPELIARGKDVAFRSLMSTD